MKYNMRKVITMFAAIAIAISAHAQTVQTGIKMYNYNKQVSAQRILTPLAATDPLANYYLGLSYISQGDLSRAGATFAKYPEDPANISGTARIAFLNKDAAKGMQIAKDLAGRAKKKEWLQLKYAADAIAYTNGGDYMQAINWYKQALTRADDADVHIALGDTYRKVPGGGGDAMTNYEDVTAKDPNNSLVYSHIGDLWYDARTYQNALDNFSKAKDADNSNPLPYKSLADAYANSGQYQKAAQNIRQYLVLSDSTLSDKMDYVTILYLAQSYCDAVTGAKWIMSSNAQMPDSVKTRLYGVLGYSEISCGDSIDALKNLRTYFQMQKASRIYSGDYIQMGKLFIKLNQLDSASFYYNKGIAGDTAKDKSDTYRDIAEAYKTKKQYCESADWYNNLVKANPNTQPLDYFWRGAMYYYCKNLGQALTAFTEYEAKYPDQPSASYWMGRAQAAIDSEATKGTAVESFKKYLDMTKDKPEKKTETKIVYEYLLLYDYNSKNTEDLKIYKEKLRTLDPKDTLLLQIEEAEKTPGAKPKKAK
jgi:tetratricopeptide (TPR) repeat protein